MGGCLSRVTLFSIIASSVSVPRSAVCGTTTPRAFLRLLSWTCTLLGIACVCDVHLSARKLHGGLTTCARETVSTCSKRNSYRARVGCTRLPPPGPLPIFP